MIYQIIFKLTTKPPNFHNRIHNHIFTNSFEADISVLAYFPIVTTYGARAFVIHCSGPWMIHKLVKAISKAKVLNHSSLQIPNHMRPPLLMTLRLNPLRQAPITQLVPQISLRPVGSI